MTKQEFKKLTKRDFENGAVLDEIAKVIDERDSLRIEVEVLISILRDFVGKDMFNYLFKQKSI